MKKNFTLIELNLVIILIAIIGLTVYSSFAAGNRVWQRLKNNSPEIDAHIFLAKLSLDLRNSFQSSQVSPRGTNRELSFAILRNFDSDDYTPVYGKLSYIFDNDTGIIYRQYAGISHLIANPALTENVKREVFRGAVNCIFKYYYYNGELKDGVWKETMEGSLPQAVKAEVSFTANKKIVTLSKTISVYAGM